MTARTCCECGQSFPANGGARKCGDCRQAHEHRLTNRERQVVALVATGLTNKAIAWKLGLTENTVRVYLNDIFPKLQVTNRVELTLWWLADEQTRLAEETPRAA